MKSIASRWIACAALGACLAARSTAMAAGAGGEAASGAASWQGEWGRWQATAGGALRGASVSIFGCAGSECRVRVDVEDGVSRCESSVEDGLPLVLEGSRAHAVFSSDDPAAHACRLELELIAAPGGSGADRRLEARLAGPGCAYFCTEERVAQPGTLSFRIGAAYPRGWTRQCFADERPSRVVWCADAELQRLGEGIVAAGQKVAELVGGDSWERWNEKREALIATCATASSPAACLHERYAVAVAAWDKDVAAAAETRRRNDAEVAAPGDPARAKQLIAAIDGVYKSRFANGLVSGETFESEDILELVGVADDALYFRTHLEFYNGHLCDLWGKATFRRSGVFAFDERVAPQEQGEACHLRIEVTPDSIRLADPGGKCRDKYCGARGSFGDTSFARTARRPIRYLERLKASREFKEATAPPG